MSGVVEDRALVVEEGEHHLLDGTSRWCVGNADYRYLLGERVGPGETRLLFAMLNPSQAALCKDDATVRRVRGFTIRLGFAIWEIVNLFGRRSTDPAGLRSCEDPVGLENDVHVREAGERATWIICAWGRNGARYPERVSAVLDLLQPEKLHVLRLLSDGVPEHPLRLPNALEPTIWRRARG